MADPDPYAELGVRRDATADEIKRAFTARALALHPDTSASAAALSAPAPSAAPFSRTKQAFDLLRDRDRRAAYDRRAAACGAVGYDAESLRRRADEFQRARVAQQQAAEPGGGAGARDAGFDFSQAPTSSQHRSGRARGMRLLEQLLRPGSVTALLLLPLAVWGLSLAVAREADPGGHYGGEGHDRVRAWFNPHSRQWEPPAPWHPLFHEHRDKTKMVARRDVHASSLPPAPTAQWQEQSSGGGSAAAEADAGVEAPTLAGGQPDRDGRGGGGAPAAAAAAAVVAAAADSAALAPAPNHMAPQPPATPRLIALR